MMSLYVEILCFAKPEEMVIRKSAYLISQVIICFSGTEIEKSCEFVHLEINKKVMPEMHGSFD